VTGSEKKARAEYKALPRTEEDLQGSEVLEKCMKFEMDLNHGNAIYSKCFEEAAKAGISWASWEKDWDPLRGDLILTHIHRRQMLYDPHAQHPLLDDARYLLRQKFVPVEVAKALWPKFADWFETKTTTPTKDAFEDDTARGGELYEHTGGTGDIHGSVRQWEADKDEWLDEDGNRVLMVECQYKVPRTALIVHHQDGTKEVYDENDRSQLMALMGGLATIKPGVIQEVWELLMCGDLIIYNRKQEANHNHYKWVPLIAFRDDKNGHPYGLIRQMRDPQEDLNKRLSKALHAMNTTRVIYEEGAIHDDTDIEIEAARPDSIIKLNPDSMNRVKIDRDTGMAKEQIEVARLDRLAIQEISGINMETMGLETNATSGRAIYLRQAQGNTIIANLFDAFRLFKLRLGYILASLIQQYYGPGKVIRITDELGAPEFMPVNQTLVDPETGKTYIRNDITRIKYDIVIGEKPFSDTVRQAMMQQVMEMVSKLPPDIGVFLLDLVFENSDVPGREKFVQRIREIIDRLRAQQGMAPAGEDLSAQEQQGPEAQIPSPVDFAATQAAQAAAMQ